MKKRGCSRGSTLLELLIVLSIFSIVIGAVYSLYITILQHATAQRKMVKTEYDVMTAGWPLLKEIQTAGFGVPETGACSPPITYAEGVLTIHSTASGNGKHAGAWSYVSENCRISDIPDGDHITVLNTVTKKFMGVGSVAGGKISPCTVDYYVHSSAIAYWIPSPETACYETSYALRKYASGTRPSMCAPSTRKFSRSVSKTPGITRYQPLLDCIFGRDPQGDEGVQFLFGCIHPSGNIIWKKDAECGNAQLRFIRIAMLIQSSPKRELQAQETFIFFADCDSSLQVTIDLNEEQRFYKWITLEHTVNLRNLG